jgi:predicted transcriptional regulator
LKNHVWKALPEQRYYRYFPNNCSSKETQISQAQNSVFSK